MHSRQHDEWLRSSIPPSAHTLITNPLLFSHIFFYHWFSLHSVLNRMGAAQQKWILWGKKKKGKRKGGKWRWWICLLQHKTREASHRRKGVTTHTHTHTHTHAKKWVIQLGRERRARDPLRVFTFTERGTSDPPPPPAVDLYPMTRDALLRLSHLLATLNLFF